MTPARRPRLPGPKPDAIALYDPERTTVNEAVTAAARAEGCTCNPEVTIKGVSAYLRHDQHCALLRRKDVN
jgi:excisionase family DNA binding protein